MPESFENRYDLQKTIGHPGSYGQVCGAIDRKTKEAVAVKIMRKPVSTLSKRERSRAMLMRSEVMVATTIRHPCVVKFYDVVENETHVHIVMEKCNGGDLFDRIMKYGGKVPEPAAANIFGNLLRAVVHIHRERLVHGDIKLSNIMFADERDSSLRLIDFGMSQACQGGEPLREIVGTPNYQSPDVISGSYSFPSDCWSLGVVLFVMIFGFNPFDPFGNTDDTKTIHGRVLAGFNPVTKSGYGAFFPSDIPASNEVKHLIARLMTSKPCARMTALEAMNHPWVVAALTPLRQSQTVSLAPCA
ncbi:non-specific serine/threonine protein kinase [Plasmodiophora brassicae]|uniref:Protein kinase domain-containing protein n=1 Tax=Plasmodiophora brassicae TaxID=37360 RepID=A0A0G4IL15_PLABS|nr:hypothetical protein PBRA_004495 [Plasmodiophora brassicae]